MDDTYTEFTQGLNRLVPKQPEINPWLKNIAKRNEAYAAFPRYALSSGQREYLGKNPEAVKYILDDLLKQDFLNKQYASDLLKQSRKYDPSSAAYNPDMVKM